MTDAGRDHRHRRGRAERHRRRTSTGVPCSRGTRGTGPITLFDPAGYPTRLAGEVPGFDAADHVDDRLAGADRPVDLDVGLAATQLALADARLTRRAADPYATRCAGQLVGRQRVRAAGDPDGCGAGRRHRRRVPVDRLVLRGQRRADLDPAPVQGPVRGGGQPRPPAGWTASAHAARAVRRGTPGGDRRRRPRPAEPVRPGLPAPSGLLSDGADPSGPTGRSTPTPTATCPPRAARCSWWRSWGTRWPGARRRCTARSTGWGATHDAHHHADPRRRRRPVRPRHAAGPGPGRGRAGGRGRGVARRARRAPHDRSEAVALRAVFGDRPPR